MKIKFLGAVGEVTGSKHLLECADCNILIDCGLHQGINAENKNRKIHSLIDGIHIDAIILTHAHLDHCGYLPRMYKDGFRGHIFCTPETKELIEVILKDNAKIMKQKKEIEEFSYSDIHIHQVMSLIKTHPINSMFNFKSLQIEFRSAGHILGACSPLIKCQVENKSILFSGDLGRETDFLSPIRQNAPKHVDTIVVESTYGDREHTKVDIIQKLKELIKKVIKNNAALVIPAFSLGRSQTILYLLKEVYMSDSSIDIPIYIDSPMTQKINEIYEKYIDSLNTDKSLFEFIHNKCTKVEYLKQKSKMLNTPNAHIILSASGMLSGGNILKHITNKAQNKTDILLLTGYQSEGTLGYQILNGERSFSINDEDIEIEMDVINFPYLSSHLDSNEICYWLKDAAPSNIFLIHGEENSLKHLANLINTTLDIAPTIPKVDKEYIL